jgi:hypothetical protein
VLSIAAEAGDPLRAEDIIADANRTTVDPVDES